MYNVVIQFKGKVHVHKHVTSTRLEALRALLTGTSAVMHVRKARVVKTRSVNAKDLTDGTTFILTGSN